MEGTSKEKILKKRVILPLIVQKDKRVIISLFENAPPETQIVRIIDGDKR